MTGKKEIFYQIKKTGISSKKNNKAIAYMCLIILRKKIHACKSKCHLKCENQVILLTVTDAKKWHYLAVKELSALLRGITSKHEGDFYCVNCFHSYSTKDKLKKHKDICENHDYCYIEIPKEDDKILK